MEYLTAQEIAHRWSLSKRTVQQLCAAGRIPGARKFTRAWAIPADAEKPRDPRSSPPRPAPLLAVSENLMPLMNTPFPPGRCRATAESMEAGSQRDIALAEYHSFTGSPEAAAREAGPYLHCADPGARRSACLLSAYANLSLGRIQHARFALGELNAALSQRGKSPAGEAASAFVAASGAVLLHLPLPQGLPDLQAFLPLLPPGLRAFALYVYAHYRYLQGDYAASTGIVEGALAMGAERYPIPAIYLHLVAAMDHMALKETDKARAHLLSAWALARPDDLTTTEFAICMLAARDWSNPDIAGHLHISPATVKRHLSSAMKKLGVTRRGDLETFMLK